MSPRATARSGSKPARARIGIFGGSFDPVHAGHVSLARSALRELNLDELRVVPARISPFKKSPPAVSARHRLNMLRLAFAEVKKIRLDGTELRRRGPSYSVDTVRALRRRRPGADLFLILGSDAFSAFQRWKEWRTILSLCRPVVGLRPGAPLKKNVLPALWNKNVIALRSRHPDISATAVRGGRFPEKHLPPAVRRYARRHRLYEAL